MSNFTVFGLWGKHCGILAQKLSKVCQNSNLWVQKFFVENLNFVGKIFRDFLSTDQKFYGVLSKNVESEKTFE